MVYASLKNTKLTNKTKKAGLFFCLVLLFLFELSLICGVLLPISFLVHHNDVPTNGNAAELRASGVSIKLSDRYGLHSGSSDDGYVWMRFCFACHGVFLLTSRLLVPMMGTGMRTPNRGPSKGIYLGNVHPETTEADLRTVFSPYGVIENIKMLKDKNCAFVNFVDIASSAAAHQAGQSGLLLRGQQVRVNWGRQSDGGAAAAMAYGVTGMGGMTARAPGIGPKPQQGPTRVLWVGNIPFDASQAELASIFAVGAGRAVRKEGCF
jgi:hypothetical protein